VQYLRLKLGHKAVSTAENMACDPKASLSTQSQLTIAPSSTPLLNFTLSTLQASENYFVEKDPYHQYYEGKGTQNTLCFCPLWTPASDIRNSKSQAVMSGVPEVR
jgi:hypothetical protein